MDAEEEKTCQGCGELVTLCICCQGCNGEGSWLPAGACGDCEFCPAPMRCSACRGTGKLPRPGLTDRGGR